MAVPRSKRKESSMQYIDTWRRACAEIFRFSNRLPKRYAFRMANPLCQHAYEGLYHLKAANGTYVKDGATFDVRRSHLLAAKADIDHVEALLDVLSEVQQPSGCVAAIAEAIDKERGLISGVMRRDSQAFARARQERGAN